jgi:hypothetical protein
VKDILRETADDIDAPGIDDKTGAGRVNAFQAVTVALEMLEPPFQYAAKVVCGRAPQDVLAPGTYFTAVNIHNATSAATAFRWKVAAAEPGRPGEVSAFFNMRLGADQAVELDCRSIRGRAGERAFLKGFVVVQSRVPLDIVSVYSAAGPAGRVETLDVEYVPERRAAGCPASDLVVESIARPTCEGGNMSVINAVIRNVGAGEAGRSIARVIDPTTLQETGAPYNSIADVPALSPGATFTAVFGLPYCVFNPEATLEVTADYKNFVKECNESNNTRVFHGTQ